MSRSTPTTGAAQLVKVHERVEEIVVPTYVAVAEPAPSAEPLFAEVSEGDLLQYGVPPDWVDEVQQATED